jgi:prepilin-type N-terminal cleavage/methylation domain-containing protein
MRNGKEEKGFTLVELLLVIAIIGILAGIAVPLYLGERTKAAQTEAKSNLQALRLLEEQFFAENACYYKNSSGDCANGNINTTLVGGKVTFTFLPGFKPGDDNSLKFRYMIVVSGTPSASAYRAEANGKNGTNVAGSRFCLDQDNSKVCP